MEGHKFIEKKYYFDEGGCKENSFGCYGEVRTYITRYVSC